MKDFLKNYTHKNRSQVMAIIGVSFVLALGINFVLGNGQFGKSIKSSVVDRIEGQESQGDLYLSLIDNGSTIALKAGRDFKATSKINFSLSYNPEGIKLISTESQMGNLTLQNTSNEPGYQSSFGLFINPQDIKPGNIIAKINIEKLSQNVEYINLISTNTQDTSNSLTELSSSGIDF